MGRRQIKSWEDIVDRLNTIGEINSRSRDTHGYVLLVHREYAGTVNGKPKSVRHLICTEHTYVYLEAHKDVVLSENEVIYHINNIPHDNRLENLQVLTYSQNALKRDSVDRSRQETSDKRFASAHKSFTKEQVLEIRRKYAEGVSQAELCRLYNVQRPTICLLVNNKTYTKWL